MSITGRTPEVSVLIPTYNGGREFAEVLAAIVGQESDFEYEVIVVDSGSSDGTRELARRYSARVLDFPKASFNHGSVRNYGISEARGEYIVMTVQDALPADSDWMRKLVENLVRDEDVAGAYGRQVPRSDSNPFSRYALEQHFTNRSERVVQEMPEEIRYRSLMPHQKLELITFDDVSSCIRRSAWEEHPLEPVSFGEDLRWSNAVLKAGYKIVYEPESVVIHSHNRSALYEMKRTYMTHKLLSQMIGMRSVPDVKTAKKALPQLVKQRWKLAEAAGGGTELYAQAVTRSVGDLAGLYLGGLAGGSARSPIPEFVDRHLSSGV